MVLPLNPADEPLAAIKDGEQPRPLLAFCKTPQDTDTSPSLFASQAFPGTYVKDF